MLFSIYGLEFDVPKEFKIQIYKGSLFFEGTVEFTDFQNNTIKADWNAADKVLGEERDVHCFFKAFLDRIKAERQLEKFDLKEITHDGMAGHDYYFYNLTYTTARKFPRKEISDYLIGFGSTCKEDDRVIVIQYRPPEGQAGIKDTVLDIIHSFRWMCGASK
jgi:hypothetical protein